MKRSQQLRIRNEKRDDKSKRFCNRGPRKNQRQKVKAQIAVKCNQKKLLRNCLETSMQPAKSTVEGNDKNLLIC